MCGFVGIYDRAELSAREKEDVRNMSRALRHRGPDEHGETEEEKIFFSFRRLTIIDPKGGSQPYTSDDGRFKTVYNGEIYNYRELRAELVKAGRSFKTDSEIEVLTAMYAEYGTTFINRLRGMFAFLIYDTQKDILLAARDPFGIKPLYYRKQDEKIIFAGEMKSFLFDSDYDGFKVDEARLSDYFTFQYVTEPDTLTGDIKILPKASYMICDKEGERIVSYFNPLFTPAKTDYTQKKVRLREALENSVEAHMISDVPLGSFLSSGVDSAIVTALASQLAPGIKAFSVGFNVSSYSELDDAAAIAAHLNVNHIKLECDINDFTENFEKTIYALDAPLADPSVVAIYLISREAAKHVKVVLSGEGSDELFGGYRQYRTALSAQKFAFLPKFIKKPLASLVSAFPEGMKGRAFLLRGLVPVEERYVGNAFVFNDRQKKELLVNYDPAVRFADRTKDIYANVKGQSILTKMQYCDLNTWLPSDILVKGDRLSMANSLEARVPYLDYEVFKAARDLCESDKCAHGTTKFILRDTFSDLLDKETTVRPKKGYPVPVRVWLKNELYDKAREIIKSNPVPEMINTDYALKLLEAHRKGEGDYYKHIWAVLSFITWYKLYITDAENTKKVILQNAIREENENHA